MSIDALTIRSWDNPAIEMDISCGSGTYIRSLAHDLGEALGVGAHLSALTRVSSGQFHLDDSIALETVMEDDTWMQRIVSPYDALSQYTRLTLPSAEIEHVRNGRFIPRRTDMDEQVVFAFDDNLELVAILKPRDEQWKPHKVFSRQS